MKQNLDQIKAVMHAKFEVQKATMQRLVAEEAKLRAALENLKTKPNEQPQTSISLAQHIGADLAWQKWVSKQRTLLNHQLALVLVRKAQQQKDLALAFGRNEVAQQLVLQDRERQRTALASRRETTAAQDVILYTGRNQ